MNDVMVLGLSPGTRRIGVAVMRGKSLVHYGVRTFTGKWSGKKLREILTYIRDILLRYDIREVLVKIPDKLPESIGFTQILGSLNVMCEGAANKPTYHIFSDIKKRHCTETECTAGGLMKVIAERYPELMPEYRKEMANKNPHYDKMFEAVAAALM